MDFKKKKVDVAIFALLIVIAVYTAVWWLEAESGKVMKKERI